MNDLKIGTRNRRGDWAPNEPLRFAPFWYLPWDLKGIGVWLIAYVWPWNAFHMATALAYWASVIPTREVMQTLSWDWAAWLYAVNAAGIFVMYGSVELFYYIRRK